MGVRKLVLLGGRKMEVFTTIILPIIGISSFLFYSKVYINFKYLRNGTNDDIVVTVYMFKNLLFYRMQIPLIAIMNVENSLWLQSKIKAGKSQDKTHVKREQRFIKKTIDFYMAHPGQLGHVVRLFRYFARLYHRVMGNVMTSLYCEQLEWRTRYGSEDAAITGIGRGILWALKALIITRLRKNVVFTSQPIIHVDSVFGDNRLDIEFQCIFSIRLGNVINTIRNLYVIK